MSNGERLLIAAPCVGLSILVLCFFCMSVGIRPMPGMPLSFIGAICIGVLVFNRAKRIKDWLVEGDD